MKNSAHLPVLGVTRPRVAGLERQGGLGAVGRAWRAVIAHFRGIESGQSRLNTWLIEGPAGADASGID